jgi:hypothetical protein
MFQTPKQSIEESSAVAKTNAFQGNRENSIAMAQMVPK